MRILLTGVTGFAGGHLAEALWRRGERDLWGISRRNGWPAEWKTLEDKVQLRTCDLLDRVEVEQLVRQMRPEQVFHLAGYPHVGRSFKEPDAAWDGNLLASRRLFDALARLEPFPRVLHVSSGLVYGTPMESGAAFTEVDPLRPTSPYAASKAAADLLAYQQSSAPGLPIIRVRPFNHIGPRQSAEFATANFARQIAAAERGEMPPLIKTGNLSPLRDLTDVRDVAGAYIDLMDHGRVGEVYNVGTGVVHSMQAILDRLLAQARLPIETRTQEQLVRDRETHAVRCDAGKLTALTGWQPTFTLDQTLEAILTYWRQHA